MLVTYDFTTSFYKESEINNMSLRKKKEKGNRRIFGLGIQNPIVVARDGGDREDSDKK